MACNKVPNMLNAPVVYVLRVVHTSIFTYIILWNVCYKTDTVDHIYKFELSLFFELGALLYPTFNQRYCLKYIFRVRLLFE